VRSGTFDSGACWHRWEPHIHAPGTVLNDQFKGADPWNDYLTALESRTPVIRALGITDYYSLSTYERVVEEKGKGRPPQCDLIFPSIELRLKLGTVKGAWVNLHLLVSPDDPNHVEEAKRVLSRLTFDAHDDRFACQMISSASVSVPIHRSWIAGRHVVTERNSSRSTSIN
jgi:hypothetical protein